ncbi:MAG: BrnT family toxin [Patescibacteria group bacterium]
MTIKADIQGFEWDQGNSVKNLKKHGISTIETEEIFLDEHLKVEIDIKHSESEQRYIAFGKTQKERVLFVVFTMRQGKIRIVSSRIANQKEKLKYDQA